MNDISNLHRIRTLALKARFIVSTSFAGAYHSTFKGRGITFDSVRPYENGDDVRRIDWNITARTHQLHIKKFVEERELNVMLLVDSSSSLKFSETGLQKRERLLEIAALLTFSAFENRDKVGLLTFSDRIENYIPLGHSLNHNLRIVRELLACSFQGTRSNWELAVSTSHRLLKERSLIFILSDFLSSDELVSSSHLNALSARHEVIAIVIYHTLERELPKVGLIPFHDLETGRWQWIDTRSKRWRQAYQAQMHSLTNERDQIFKRAGVHHVEISTKDDYVTKLITFLASYD